MPLGALKISGVLRKALTMKSALTKVQKQPPEMFYEKGVFKKRLWHRCFSMLFAKFLRAPLFIEHF